ncbi:hypothetical protein OURE66S_03582 [Oligella ureolytica]
MPKDWSSVTQNYWRDSSDDAPGQLLQLNRVVEDLTSGVLGLGDHHATLTLFLPEHGGLERAMANTAALLAEKSGHYKTAGAWTGSRLLGTIAG